MLHELNNEIEFTGMTIRTIYENMLLGVYNRMKGDGPLKDYVGYRILKSELELIKLLRKHGFIEQAREKEEVFERVFGMRF